MAGEIHLTLELPKQMTSKGIENEVEEDNMVELVGRLNLTSNNL